MANDWDDFYSALNAAAKNAPGGIAGIAERRGIRPRNLYDRLDPRDITHGARVEDLKMVLDESGDDTPLEILCQMRGGQFVTRNQSSALSLMTALLKVGAEQGDVFRAAKEADANGDGELDDDTKRRELLKQVRELRQAAVEMENMLSK